MVSVGTGVPCIALTKRHRDLIKTDKSTVQRNTQVCISRQARVEIQEDEIRKERGRGETKEGRKRGEESKRYT